MSEYSRSLGKEELFPCMRDPSQAGSMNSNSRASESSPSYSSLFNAPMISTPIALHVRMAAQRNEEGISGRVAGLPSSCAMHGPSLPSNHQDTNMRGLAGEVHPPGSSFSSPNFSGFTPEIYPASGGGGVPKIHRHGKGAWLEGWSPTASFDQDAPPWIPQHCSRGGKESTPKNPTSVDNSVEEAEGGKGGGNNGGGGKSRGAIPIIDTRGMDYHPTLTGSNYCGREGETNPVPIPASTTPLSDHHSIGLASPKAVPRRCAPARNQNEEKSSPIAIPTGFLFHSFRGHGGDTGIVTTDGSPRMGALGSACGCSTTVGSLFPSSLLQVGTYELDALPAEASLSAGLYDGGFSRALGSGGGGSSFIPPVSSVLGDFDGSPRGGYDGGENASYPGSPEIFRARIVEDDNGGMSKMGTPPHGGVDEGVGMYSRYHHYPDRGGHPGYSLEPTVRLSRNNIPSEFIQPSALASSFPDLSIHPTLSQDIISTNRSGSHFDRNDQEEVESDCAPNSSLPFSSMHEDPYRKTMEIYSFPKGKNRTSKGFHNDKNHQHGFSENFPPFENPNFARGVHPRFEEVEDDPDAPPFMRQGDF